MKFGLHIRFAILAGVLAVAHAQTHNPFQVAYDANQLFELRDAVEHSTAPLFYKAAVEASLNSVHAAEKDLHSIIDAAPDSQNAYEAHDLLGNMYFRNGMYRDAFSEITAALKERPDAADPKSMLPIFTALNELPPMTIVAMRPSTLQIEPDSIFLPLKLDGKEAEFFFDTGAGISCIGESEAKELGLVTKMVEGKMGDASGQGVTGLRVALVADLIIGGLHLRNVPFVVLPDSGEPWNQLPRRKRGIIGIPVLLAMHTLRWTPKGSFEFGFPTQPLNVTTCNMLFHNSNPVIDVHVERKRLNFTLDTGAVDTDLNPAFAKTLPALMKSGTPENRPLEGLGGTVNGDSILLPSVTLQIGNRNTVLKPAHVFTEHGNGTWAAGNLGMDVLKQAPAFTLDFGAMTLRLE
jgi:predicted aspartyl protease